MRIVSKTILAFLDKGKLPDFTEKLKIASGKSRINMVTWSFLLLSNSLSPWHTAKTC